MDKFKTGYFGQYQQKNLTEALQHGLTYTAKDSTTRKPLVFISHKHDDLKDLKELIRFLETFYNCSCYIDSLDSNLPVSTSGTTALQIKKKIVECDKFILLATQNAIESKWCNWELGYGDAFKSAKNNLALLFIYSNSEDFGNEYMQNYPYIVYRTGNEKYSDGSPIKKGFYLRYFKNNKPYLVSLEEWLNERA